MIFKHVSNTSEVTLRFVVKNLAGEIIEDSQQYEMPARLVMGHQDLPPGFEKCLLGLKVGDRKSFILTPDEAFGVKDPQSIYQLPRQKFDPETLEIGMVHSFIQPDHSELLGIVTAIHDHHVTVDFNHPLAGQGVIFEVEILGVN